MATVEEFAEELYKALEKAHEKPGEYLALLNESFRYACLKMQEVDPCCPESVKAWIAKWVQARKDDGYKPAMTSGYLNIYVPGKKPVLHANDGQELNAFGFKCASKWNEIKQAVKWWMYRSDYHPPIEKVKLSQQQVSWICPEEQI